MMFGAKERARIFWHPRVRAMPAPLRAAYVALLEAAPPSGELTLDACAAVFGVLAASPADTFAAMDRAGLSLPHTNDAILVVHPDIADGAAVFA